MPNSKPWRTIVVRRNPSRELMEVAAPVRVKRRKEIRVREEDLMSTPMMGAGPSRFTQEQIEAAVRAVMAEREAREARARARTEGKAAGRGAASGKGRKNAAGAPRTGA